MAPTSTAKPLLTLSQLTAILPLSKPVAANYLPGLLETFEKRKIDSPHRIAAFLAQVAQESGSLRTVVENLNYSAEALLKTWPKRFTPQTAAAAARKPEAIAEIVYTGRMGNTQKGDGFKYRGRGLIQVTGKDNYTLAAKALGLDLVNRPELLEQPANAVASAGWFWEVNKLNALADAGRIDDVSSLVNTGAVGRTAHGAVERRNFYNLALKVLS